MDQAGGKSFGVMLVQDRPLDELLQWATRFDQAGVDSLWVPDHLANPSDPGGMWFDGWTVLTAMAASTSRCRVGPLVSNFVSNSPLRMARLVVSVDALSNGRLDLGLGLGNAPVCRSASVVPDDGPTLVRRFERGLEDLWTLLADEPIELAVVPTIGGFPAPESIRLSTPLVQTRRPPVVIGGHGPRVLDIAAAHADRWNVYYPPGATTFAQLPSALGRLTAQFEERCEERGRAGMVGRSILLDYSPALQPAGQGAMVDLVGSLYELGFDECIATAWPVPGDDVRSEELLRFIQDDLPGLRTV